MTRQLNADSIDRFNRLLREMGAVSPEDPKNVLNALIETAYMDIMADQPAERLSEMEEDMVKTGIAQGVLTLLHMVFQDLPDGH